MSRSELVVTVYCAWPECSCDKSVKVPIDWPKPQDPGRGLGFKYDWRNPLLSMRQIQDQVTTILRDVFKWYHVDGNDYCPYHYHEYMIRDSERRRDDAVASIEAHRFLMEAGRDVQ